VDAYGPDVLGEPEAKGFDLSAWLVPGALVALAAVGVTLVARRWRREPAPEAPADDLDPSDARRLDAELASFDR
jgi:cytochrome c-type biogenesis protein CcmH/NrfF